MKKLLMLLPLLLLVSCTQRPQLVAHEDKVVYTNDGDHIVYVFEKLAENQEPIIETEYWDTLTIDNSLAYLETEEITAIFSLNIYSVIIVQEVW